MEGFQELKELVFHYLRGIWRYRWIAIIVAWPLAIGGVAVVDGLQDRYVAETKVYLDSSSILRPLLKGLAIETDFNAIVDLMVRKLLSRPNLERAIALMKMDSQVKSPKAMEGLILSVRNRIDVKGDVRTGTYRISYSDTNRIEARRMVETLLDIFIDDTLGKSTDESDSAIAFLDRQIQKYEQLLQQAEDRREAFKRKNLGLMPKDGANYFTQLQQVNSELERIGLSLAEAISRRDQMRSRLAELVEDNKVNIAVKSIYDQRIADQEARLVDLLLVYTEEHPDVINARSVLDALRERRDQELAVAKPARQPSLVDNLVYQEIQILLANVEADISSLETRHASFNRKVVELTKLIDIVPKIEAELQRLDRDYEVHKLNYTELVQRRETARISEDVEEGTEQVKFRIIEPPYVPIKPSFPNRVLFDLAVLVVALGIGYGLSLLVSLFQPVYSSPNEIRRNINIPLLGAVKQFDTDDVLSSRRWKLFFFIVANLLLVCSVVVLAFLHSKEMAIISNLKSVLI
jgi:polysaccharide chain length determinant protein (PEP-CTERM system associated)